MNVADENSIGENQYFTSQRIIFHLENYYKFYGPLLIFFLAIFFLLIRKIIVKNPKETSKVFRNAPVTTVTIQQNKIQEKQLAETFKKEETNLTKSPEVSNLHSTDNRPDANSSRPTDKAPEELLYLYKGAFYDSDKIDLQKADWLEIQENLRVILHDIQKCFNSSWLDKISQQSNREQIFPFKLIQNPLTKEFTNLNGFKFKDIQLKDHNCYATKKIGNWDVKISPHDIILSDKKTTVILGYHGSWSVIQEENPLSISTVTSDRQTLRNQTIIFCKEQISFDDGIDSRTCEYNKIDNDQQLRSFFTQLELAIKPNFRDLISALRK